jgi:GMP synthase-like glutamine amidotransferase
MTRTIEAGGTLRLGLLDAVPKEFHPPSEKTDPEKFIDLFKGVSAPISFATYEATEGEFPDSFDECDAWLITGSPCSVYDTYDWIKDLGNFIRHAHAEDRPLVGICFGHQLIAQSLGGKVRLAHDGWLLGLHPIDIRRQKPWMQNPSDSHSLYFINQDQVYDLPPDAELLGGSAACPHAMYSIGKRVLCLQAHPEQPLSSMQTFTRILRDEYHVDSSTIDAAHTTMAAGKPHAELFAKWISDFLVDAVSRPALG